MITTIHENFETNPQCISQVTAVRDFGNGFFYVWEAIAFGWSINWASTRTCYSKN